MSQLIPVTADVLVKPLCSPQEHGLESSGHSVVSYGLDMNPFEGMGGVVNSALAVTRIRIDAIADGQAIGQLDAQIFDMQKISALGAMGVFEESSGTDAFFSMIYSGSYAANAAEYPFTEDFSKVLKDYLGLKNVELTHAQCMGFRIAHLERVKIDKAWQRQGIGTNLVKEFLTLERHFDFVVGQVDSIEFNEYVREHYPVHALRKDFLEAASGRLMNEYFQQGLNRFYQRLGMKLFEAEGVTWFILMR